MSHALTIGPLLLPYSLLVVFAAVAASVLVGKALAKRAGIEAEGVLWRTLFVALLAARLAFVFEYRVLYFASPLSILDIRDGGWNPAVGLVAAWLYALHRQRRAPILARPLRWAVATGTTLFVIGSALLVLRPGTTGEALPHVSFESIEGEAVALERFVGQPIVVNLWATWCPPCVREMPVLQQAQSVRRDVHFVFLNQGESRAVVGAWLQRQGLALRNVLIDEPRQASAVFRQQGYPTTLFFDAQGRLVSRRLGELSAATLAEKLDQISK